MYINAAHYDFEKFPDTTGLSPSSLNTFKKCPYYYWAQRVAKFWQDEPKEAFIVGGGADCLITEGHDAYGKKFIVTPRRTKQAQLQAEADGLVLITEKQNTLIRSMNDELTRQPIYSRFQGQGWINQDWIEADLTDGFDGSSVHMRGKMDYYHKEAGIIADLKTCANLDKFKPQWYAMQMGLYHEMVKIRDGIDCKVFIIAVDKTDETRSRFFMCSPETLQEGKTQARRIIEQLKACRDEHAWDKQPYDEEEVHDCPTYATCPYAIQKRIFTF